MLFDSHCHLTDTRFEGDRSEVLARAREAGVTRIVTVGSDLEDSRAAAALAAGADGVWSTAGVHPHMAGAARAGDLEALAELIQSHPSVVAVGETGLDYHYENSPRDVQRRWFREQLALARTLARPVVVHSREADEDTAAILTDFPDVTVVLHCFSGGATLLDAALAMGCYVSFSGIVSFKNFHAHDAVRAVPGDRLLLETDAPYLAPVPKRGKRNEPAFVGFVAEAVAAHLGDDPQVVARRTTRNALRFYDFDE